MVILKRCNHKTHWHLIMSIKTCPQCHEQLRFPDHIGGMLMACPSCGQEFYSDFKLANTTKPKKLDSNKETNRQQETITKKPGGFSVVV
ncbi:MAG: hypothetical protein OEL55_00770 [Desulfobulbaceae bacterium]|nr:hypothetical protein [Desulfobulbaceae bacterium]